VIENNNTNVTNNEYDTSNITNNTNIDDSTTTTVFDDSTTTLDYTSAFGSSPLAGLAAPAPMPDLSFSDPSLSTDYSSFMSPLAGLAPTTTSPPLFDYSDSTSPLAGLVPPPPLAADTTITESDTLVASDANGTLVASDDQVTTIVATQDIRRPWTRRVWITWTMRRAMWTLGMLLGLVRVVTAEGECGRAWMIVETMNMIFEWDSCDGSRVKREGEGNDWGQSWEWIWGV
jgi:hypothetical protein